MCTHTSCFLYQSSPTSRLPYQGYDEQYEGMHVAGSPLPEYAPASASPNDAASTGSSLGSEAMDHAINHALLAVGGSVSHADYVENWRQETQRWAFQWEDFTEPDESDEMDSPAVVATPLDVQMAIPQDTPGLPLEGNTAVDVGADLPTLARTSRAPRIGGRDQSFVDERDHRHRDG